MYRKTIFLSLVAALIFGITDTALALDLKTQAQNEVIDNFIKQLITGVFFISFAGVTGLVAWLYSRVTGKRVEGAEVKEGGLVIVSRLRRLTNFSVDFLIVINAIVAAISYGAIATEWYFPFENWLLFSVGTVVLYYWLLEGLFGRTVGKLFTNTKVVASDGNRANASAILGRTLIRLIPFEVFSFLGTSDSGWHDRWSKTAVVKVGYKTTPTDERRVLSESEPEERQVTESEPLIGKQEGLGGKWWYRLLQVVYGIGLIASILVGMIFVYDEYQPRQVRDVYQSYVECADGKRFTAADLGVTPGGAGIGRDFNWFRISGNADRLKKICIKGSIDEAETPLSLDEYTRFNSSTGEHYRVVEGFKVTGSWGNVILFSVGTILLIGGVFLVVRKLFLYVYKGDTKLFNRKQV